MLNRIIDYGPSDPDSRTSVETVLCSSTVQYYISTPVYSTSFSTLLRMNHFDDLSAEATFTPHAAGRIGTSSCTVPPSGNIVPLSCVYRFSDRFAA